MVDQILARNAQRQSGIDHFSPVKCYTGKINNDLRCVRNCYLIKRKQLKTDT